MAGLDHALSPYSVLGLDTSLFIYFVEDHPQFGEVSETVFQRLGGGAQGVTSVITLMEISVKPIREQLTDVAYLYSGFLESIENLAIIPIHADDAWLAGSLRAINTLRPADALQVAACIGAGADVFVTNDRRLRRISEIDVLCLADYV